MFDSLNRMAAMAVLGLLATPADAQRWDRMSLDKKLETALDHNPQILLAKAKVRQAEAEYQATRLEVTRQVLELNARYKGQRQVVAMTLRTAERAKLLFKEGRMSEAEAQKAEREYLEAQNELAQLEAESRYILGAQTSGKAESEQTASKDGPRKRPLAPEKFAGHLKVSVDVNFEDAPLTEVIASFAAIVDNEQFVTRPMKLVIDKKSLDDEVAPPDQIRITLKQGKVALGDALLILADRTPVRFVFRDYGLLITTEYRAMNTWAATIPADIHYQGR